MEAVRGRVGQLVEGDSGSAGAGESAVRVVSEAEFADWLAKNKASAARDDDSKVAAAQD